MSKSKELSDGINAIAALLEKGPHRFKLIIESLLEVQERNFMDQRIRARDMERALYSAIFERAKESTNKEIANILLKWKDENFMNWDAFIEEFSQCQN